MHNQHKILRVFQLINLLKSSPAKSINHLAKTLEMDSRSIYRYFDLLRVLGFQLEKNNFHRYSIMADESESVNLFSLQETLWLKALILTAGNESVFCDSVLKKLHVNSEINIKGEQVFKAHLSNLVHLILKAKEDNKQIILKKYYSANSQNIEDRLVEPIEFTENYKYLIAFEPSSQMVKHFHIERITGIVILNLSMQYTHLHAINPMDVFGFAKSEKSFPLDLWLSLRGYVFLKEEYPMTTPFLKYNKNRDQYRLRVTVNNMAPIERFMKGLEGEIIVN